MAEQPIVLRVDAVTFAALVANDYPDGQQVCVVDDGFRVWEAAGADGARSWVQLGVTVTVDAVRDAGRWEVLLDGAEQPVSDGAGDWLYEWVDG